MMSSSQKFLLKITHFARWNCTEKSVKPVQDFLETNLDLSKKLSVKKRKADKNLKGKENEIISPVVSDSGKDNENRLNNENLNDSASSADEVAETKIVKNEEKEEAEETTHKTPYVKPSNFVIRNILTCPLHKSSTEKDFHELGEESKSSRTLIPSVSCVLQKTMSKESQKLLEQWKAKMIRDLGYQNFMNQQKACLNRGTKFHSSIRKYLMGENFNTSEIDKDVEGCWESVKAVLPMISDVKLVEENVHHPILLYKGVVDCVASYKNVPCVIEWKQSEKARYQLSSTYDAPVQICAYMGALTWCKKLEPISNGLVVVAYPSGSPADVFPMNENLSQTYWLEWLRRLQRYWVSHPEETETTTS